MKREHFCDSLAASSANDSEFIAAYNGIPVINNAANSGKNSSIVSYYGLDNSTSQKGRRNIIIYNISSSFITNSIRSMNKLQDNSDTNFIVTDKNGRPICSVVNEELSQNEELYDMLYQNTASSNKFLRINGKSYLTAVTRANENEWYLFSLTPFPSLFRTVFISAAIGTIIMVIVLLACFAVCLYLARRLNSPIQAISNIMKGETSDADLKSLQGTEEFRQILDSYETIRQQNQQLSHTKWEHAHSSRQNYLNLLLTGNRTESREQIVKRLEELELSWLVEDSLCMAVFKIDNYRNFCDSNNPDELWILRFAIVNIMEETAGHYFTNCVSNQDSDKFVLLLCCKEELPFKELTDNLETMLSEVQKNVQHYMKISMSAAYSSPFDSSSRLSRIYGNLKDALHLKMKLGHGSIISPRMQDDLETENYQFPDALADELIQQILAGKTTKAQSLAHKLSLRLFVYEYSEILSGMIHLLYSIYLDVTHKYPQLTEDATHLLKKALSNLQAAEVTEDLEMLLDSFTARLCDKIITLMQDTTQDNTTVLTKRVKEIIEQNYSNPALCLGYIAEKIGLTPNYIGKIFKSTTQISVSQYITDYRMEMLAKYLDETELPLNTILDKVGIEKTNYFYTQFKKHFGISLMEYRKRPEK